MRHLTYANTVATLALIFAMSGAAAAGSRYLITSTSQIKPSVLRKLEGKTGKEGKPGAGGALSFNLGLEGKPGKDGASVTGAEGPAGPAGALGIVDYGSCDTSPRIAFPVNAICLHAGTWWKNDVAGNLAEPEAPGSGWEPFGGRGATGPAGSTGPTGP